MCIRDRREIFRLIDETIENGAKIVVFPELCITGYTCGDLFSQDILLSQSAKALEEIAAYTTGDVYKRQTLYIRPYMFGTNPVIGVKPADEYQFRVFATPVGPYFKGGAKPITIRVCDFDRAAPHGTCLLYTSNLQTLLRS